MSEPELEASTRVARREQVIAERLLDETVILDPESGTYLRLNSSGSWVWEQLGEPRTVAQLATTLVERFSLQPARAHADVGAFVRALEARGLADLSR